MEDKKTEMGPEELIPGYLKDELTLREVDELLEWIKSDEKNKKTFDEYSEIWLMAQHSSGNSGYDAEKGFQYFKERINKEEERGKNGAKRIVIPLVRYAAIALISLAIGALSYHYIRNETPTEQSGASFSELIVPYGGNAKYTMTDGTVVNLNAGSKLKFGNSYGVTDRNVELTGEGYFEVSKNELLPFNVVTSHLTVTALGTVFNVKAYENDPIIEATLVEGSIKIDKKNSGKREEPILLEPNQKLTFVKSELETPETGNIRNVLDSGEKQSIAVSEVAIPNVQISSVDVEPVIAWKDNRWIFENQSLSLIAVEMERRYDVEIEIETDRLKNSKFTGTIITEPIEQVLEALSLVIPIDFEVEGKIVTITEHESFDKMINRKLYNSY